MCESSRSEEGTGLLKKTITSLAGACVLTVPAGDLWAATQGSPTKRVVRVTKTVLGKKVQCKQWGALQISITVRKTTTTVDGRSAVTIRLLEVSAPAVPAKTFKTRYIHDQTLPVLFEQVVQLQSARVDAISGATDTIASFKQSLLSALANARR
jgi:uncharacterized protein with FMN-binding domain